MKPTRRTPPTTVKLICAVLILAPLIEGATRFVQAQGHILAYRELPSGWIWLGSFALHACVAVGLARGVNWLRWGFVLVAGLKLLLELNSSMAIVIGSPPPLPMGIGLILWMAYFAVVILCVVPSTGAHFTPKQPPNQSPEPTRVLGTSAAAAPPRVLGTSAAEPPRVPSTRVAHL